MKVTIRLENEEEFWAGTRELFRRLDRKKPVEAESVVSIESLGDLQALLTEERLRLFRAARRSRYSLSGLAEELKRDRKSVVRDVEALRRLGLVRLRREANPGHGVVQIVEPTTGRLDLHIAI